LSEKVPRCINCSHLEYSSQYRTYYCPKTRAYMAEKVVRQRLSGCRFYEGG